MHIEWYQSAGKLEGLSVYVSSTAIKLRWRSIAWEALWTASVMPAIACFLSPKKINSIRYFPIWPKKVFNFLQGICIGSLVPLGQPWAPGCGHGHCVMLSTSVERWKIIRKKRVFQHNQTLWRSLQLHYHMASYIVVEKQSQHSVWPDPNESVGIIRNNCVSLPGKQIANQIRNGSSTVHHESRTSHLHDFHPICLSRLVDIGEIRFKTGCTQGCIQKMIHFIEVNSSLCQRDSRLQVTKASKGSPEKYWNQDLNWLNSKLENPHESRAMVALLVSEQVFKEKGNWKSWLHDGQVPWTTKEQTHLATGAVNPTHAVSKPHLIYSLRLKTTGQAASKKQRSGSMRAPANLPQLLWSNRKGTGSKRTWRSFRRSSRKAASLVCRCCNQKCKFFEHIEINKTLFIADKPQKTIPLSLATKRNPPAKRPQQAAQYKLGNWPALMLRRIGATRQIFAILSFFWKSNKRNPSICCSENLNP